MSTRILDQIQTLQFSDKPAAEQLLTHFVQAEFGFEIHSVELRPLAVSLNSFNGFVTLTDGKRLFFKTHTEPDNVIGEYYNAAMLSEAGYPVIQPRFASVEAGKQFLIYEEVLASSVFDVAWEIENGKLDYLPILRNAQNNADEDLFRIYCKTLEYQSSEQSAQAPIHQLFYHRLVGGRLQRFYGSNVDGGRHHQIYLPAGTFNMGQVRQASWRINGQEYNDTIEELTTAAIRLLDPAQHHLTIIGHGDAHNGNVFLDANKRPPSLLYFDPAFAGRHDPLLDIAKPLFHNVFAMWMYYPHVKTQKTRIKMNVSNTHWDIEHDYEIPPVRHMFLRSKIDRLLIPILTRVKKQGQLRANWADYLKAALFCCPYLTMNLTDTNRFTPEMSLLGLTMAVEMGAKSSGKRSLIDQVLDEIELVIV